MDSLRAILGGSDSTVLRFLRARKEQRAASKMPSPAGITTTDVDAVLRGWAEGLLAQAQERHAAVLAVEKESRATAESLVEQYEVELKRLRKNKLKKVALIACMRKPITHLNAIARDHLKAQTRPANA